MPGLGWGLYRPGECVELRGLSPIVTKTRLALVLIFPFFRLGTWVRNQPPINRQIAPSVCVCMCVCVCVFEMSWTEMNVCVCVCV